MTLQLPLGITLPAVATFDSYIAGLNELMVDLLKQCAQGMGEQQIYYWGASGSGKSHLLQAICHKAGDNDVSNSRLSITYLPLDQLLDHGPDILEGLESLDVICIDDLQLLSGNSRWEGALFSLINKIRAAHGRLIMAADVNVNELGIKLPDLLSRLSWGPVFQLKPLNDDDKLKALKQLASARGLELSDEVGRYMLRRYHRSMTFLCEQLDCLDKASLAAQRRLTVPFIKSILD